MRSNSDSGAWSGPAAAASVVIVLGLLFAPSGFEVRLKAFAAGIEHPFTACADALIRGLRAMSSPHGSAAGVDVDRACELMRENADLRLRLHAAEVYRSENEFLKRRLGFRARDPRVLVVCRVVSRDPVGGFHETVRLNRGSADGLEPGMALITEDGLAGKVTDVYVHRSRAILISSPECMIPCYVPSREIQAVLVGHQAGTARPGLSMLLPARCQLEYITGDGAIDLEVGDTVYTSGLGDMLKTRDIPIGVVRHVDRDSAGICRGCSIDPHARLSQLTFVYAVLSG